MYSIDTHAHLCDQRFNDDLEEVIIRADQDGVGAIVLVGETLEDGKRNLELSEKFPSLKAAAGLYPEFADMEAAEQLIQFITYHHQELVGIGEVGLDFWIAKQEMERELQREVFQQFIRLSNSLQLPLNVHSRSAGRHAVAMLLENNASQVQLHGFDGKASSALPAVEAGFFFSVPPSIVRSRQKQKLVKQLPLSCLLVESDSPVLGPTPDERNEPVNIAVSLSAIAEIKEISLEQVAETVLENTGRLYGALLEGGGDEVGLDGG